MSGDAFTNPTDDDTVDATTPEAFNVRSWIKGTGLVTRTVSVFGKPQLLGRIEALQEDLARAQATEFDDDRPYVKSAATRISQEIEELRAEMYESQAVFTFRSLKAGEYEAMKAEHGSDDTDEIGSDFDVRVWARQCIKVSQNGQAVHFKDGIPHEDFLAMYRGDTENDIEGLGPYFLQTIGRTANQAAQGGGVDVPFSAASSSLRATSSKS